MSSKPATPSDVDTLPSIDGECHARQLPREAIDECASRLELLQLRIAQHLGRLQESLQEVQARASRQAAESAVVDRMASTLREEQANWEREKQKQAERIAEQLNHLTAAWDRIEAERRGQVSADVELIPSPPPDAAGADAARPVALSAVPSDPMNLLDGPVPSTGRSTAVQFQQIKREIRRHARRHSR